MTNKLKLWILDYKPRLNTFFFTAQDRKRVLNFIKNKSIPMNFIILGGHGFGKTTLINAILYEIYSITLLNFKDVIERTGVSQYKSLFYFNFIKIPNKSINDNLEFIKQISIRNFLNCDDFEKTIIMKGVDFLSQKSIEKLRSIINRYSNNCKFVLLLNRPLKILQTYFATIKLNYLNKTKMQNILCNILKENGYKPKRVLNYNLVYKTYKNNFYNFKDLLLWFQYNYQLGEKKSLMLKEKMIGSFLNHVLGKYYLTYFDDEKHFELIRGLLQNLLYSGFEYKDLISYTLNFILKQPAIEPKLKSTVIKYAIETDLNLLKTDKKPTEIEKYFIDIAIAFKGF